MELLSNAPVGTRVRLSSGLVGVTGELDGTFRWVLGVDDPEVKVRLAGATPCEFIGDEFEPLRKLLASPMATIRARLPELADADLRTLTSLGPPMWVGHEIKQLLAARTQGSEVPTPPTPSALSPAACSICQAPVTPFWGPKGATVPAHPGREPGAYCPGSGKPLELPATTTPAPPPRRTRKALKPEPSTLAGWSENITGTPHTATPSAEDREAAQRALQAADEVRREQVATLSGRSIPPAVAPPSEPPSPVVEVEPATDPSWLETAVAARLPVNAPERARSHDLLAALANALAAADETGLGLTITITLPSRSTP